MNIYEVAKFLEVEIVNGTANPAPEIEQAFESNLMSDVLTVETDKMSLITGLAKPQTIRTAEMSDVSCIVFLRGKKVTHEMQQLAIELGITLFKYSNSMLKTIGNLNNGGFKAVYLFMIAYILNSQENKRD
jgi:hypothetical protein